MPSENTTRQNAIRAMEDSLGMTRTQARNALNAFGNAQRLQAISRANAPQPAPPVEKKLDINETQIRAREEVAIPVIPAPVIPAPVDGGGGEDKVIWYFDDGALVQGTIKVFPV